MCAVRLKTMSTILALALLATGPAAAADDACFKTTDIVDWMILDTSTVFVWVSENRKAYEVQTAGTCPRLRYAKLVHFSPDASGLVCNRPGYEILVSGAICPIASVTRIED